MSLRPEQPRSIDVGWDDTNRGVEGKFDNPNDDQMQWWEKDDPNY